MSVLTIFGLAAVAVSLVCYFLQARSRWWVLGFALSCILGAVYGFLANWYWFSLFEGIWAVRGFIRLYQQSRAD
ncbi:hypothetical protein M0L20_01120 [Spirosoma sp. RP8]|uniref:DUF4175 domain-containing protein n=1 Tax=Spirosoma liriopis TaxID=2937440 RepID=A0ABT0HE45_9BACT|nr:hypothetical protein [Spirosoma liriopis]MCK8490429.1 hypothetical protein [Spirosoma liriopis]